MIERMDDGRMNLLVRGTRPFRVLERQGHLPYPAGVIEFVEDRDDEVDAELARGAHEAYAELYKRATDRDPDPEELAEMSAYAMAATVDFGLDAKQGLLDMRSENARLRLVTRLFRAAIKRLELVDKVAGARPVERQSEVRSQLMGGRARRSPTRCRSPSPPRTRCSRSRTGSASAS